MLVPKKTQEIRPLGLGQRRPEPGAGHVLDAKRPGTPIILESISVLATVLLQDRGIIVPSPENGAGTR